MSCASRSKSSCLGLPRCAKKAVVAVGVVQNFMPLLLHNSVEQKSNLKKIIGSLIVCIKKFVLFVPDQNSLF